MSNIEVATYAVDWRANKWRIVQPGDDSHPDGWEREDVVEVYETSQGTMVGSVEDGSTFPSVVVELRDAEHAEVLRCVCAVLRARDDEEASRD